MACLDSLASANPMAPPVPLQSVALAVALEANSEVRPKDPAAQVDSAASEAASEAASAAASEVALVAALAVLEARISPLTSTILPQPSRAHLTEIPDVRVLSRERTARSQTTRTDIKRPRPAMRPATSVATPRTFRLPPLQRPAPKTSTVVMSLIMPSTSTPCSTASRRARNIPKCLTSIPASPPSLTSRKEAVLLKIKTFLKIQLSRKSQLFQALAPTEVRLH